MVSVVVSSEQYDEAEPSELLEYEDSQESVKEYSCAVRLRC